MHRNRAPDPQPHPIRPGQRLGLTAARWALGALLPLQRFRAARAPIARRTLRRYGTRRLETLEVLEPEGGSSERPAVVYVHGGGWIIGRKELYTGDLGFLVESGYRVFNLDYPLAPEHPFPTPLRSLLDALEWIRREYPDGDTERIHLMGDSAGGNLAMMLGLIGTDPKPFEAIDPAVAERELPRIISVVSLYGVLDRLSWLEQRFPGAPAMLQSYGGEGAFEPEVGPEGRLAPSDWTGAKRPPSLLAIGDADPLAESSRIAHAAWSQDEAGAPVELIEYAGERHGFFNTAWRPASTELREDVLRFLDEV